MANDFGESVFHQTWPNVMIWPISHLLMLLVVQVRISMLGVSK